MTVTRRTFARDLVAIAATAATPKGIGRSRSDASDRLEDLKSRLPRLAEYAGEAIPGFSVAAIIDGSVVWTDGFGVRRALASDPVSAETVFEAASLSKPVFAAAIVRLRQDGVIDLDRPLLEYMPYPDLRDDPRAKLITARLVLSHQTGLPNWRSKEGLAFSFSPGERFGYSGEGFYWLQRVIEHITRVPFPTLMRQRIFEPFGMRRTTYVLLPEIADNAATSHTNRREPRDGIYFEQGRRQLELARRWNVPVEAWTYSESVRAVREADPTAPPIPSPTVLSPNAAASLITTAADYARFMTRCMKGSTDGLAEMLTPVTRVNRVLSYGLGWGLERESGATSFWHGGWNRGFKSFALGDVEGGAGVVLLTNSNEGDRINWPVIHQFTGRGAAALVS